MICVFRDEDRSILLELKTHGASRETFSALSEKLEKPSAQVSASRVTRQVHLEAREVASRPSLAILYVKSNVLCFRSQRDFTS